MEFCLASSHDELGVLAARDIGAALRRLLRGKAHLRMILAAAPSQGAMPPRSPGRPGYPAGRGARSVRCRSSGLPSLGDADTLQTSPAPGT